MIHDGIQAQGFSRANTFAVNGGSQSGGGGACFGERGARTTNYNDSVTTTTTTQDGVTTERTVQTHIGDDDNFDRTTVTDLAGGIVEGVISGVVSLRASGRGP